MKNLWKDHKKEIIGGTVILVIGIAVGIAIHKKMVPNYTGKKVLSWVPAKGALDLETVKKVIDLNATNDAAYAIFREGPNPADYICIFLDDKLVRA